MTRSSISGNRSSIWAKPLAMSHMLDGSVQDPAKCEAEPDAFPAACISWQPQSQRQGLTGAQVRIS